MKIKINLVIFFLVGHGINILSITENLYFFQLNNKKLFHSKMDCLIIPYQMAVGYLIFEPIQQIFTRNLLIMKKRGKK